MQPIPLKTDGTAAAFRILGTRLLELEAEVEQLLQWNEQRESQIRMREHQVRELEARFAQLQAASETAANRIHDLRRERDDAVAELEQRRSDGH